MVRTSRGAGIASIRSRCYLIRTPKPLRASCAGTMRCWLRTVTPRTAPRSPGSWTPPFPGTATSCRARRGTRRWSMNCTSKASPNNIPTCRRICAGTYAGLASPAAVEHLRELGVTAVELLPVHYHIDERFLVQRGRVNYWGYNTLGFLRARSALRRQRAGRRGGGVSGDGAAAACRGHRSHPRRGLQPHGRGQRARPHALAQGHR